MIGILQAAMIAYTKGEIGERELIAISLAVNAELPEMHHNPMTRAGHRAFAAGAAHKLMERVAELDEANQ